MPTRRGLMIVIVGVALLWSGRYVAMIEFVAAGSLLLAVGAVCAAVVWLPTRRPTFRRIVERGVCAGEPLGIALETTMRGLAPTTVVTDQVPGNRTITIGLAGQWQRGTRTHRARYAVSALGRGAHIIGPTRVTRTDLLRLFRRTATVLASQHAIVWPGVVPLDRAALLRCAKAASAGTQQGRQNAQRSVRAGRGRTVGTEAGDLRKFHDGDDIRFLHWRATARTGSLMVRPPVPEYAGATRVVLDLRSRVHSHESFELGCSAAASILLALPHSNASTARSRRVGGDVVSLVLLDDAGRTAVTNREETLDHIALLTYRAVDSDTRASPSDPAAIGDETTRDLVGALVVSGPFGELDDAEPNPNESDDDEPGTNGTRTNTNVDGLTGRIDFDALTMAAAPSKRRATRRSNGFRIVCDPTQSALIGSNVVAVGALSQLGSAIDQLTRQATRAGGTRSVTKPAAASVPRRSMDTVSMEAVTR